MSDTITKIYNASDLTVNEGKREVIAAISTDAIDRDGEVVNPMGIKRKNYAGNPIVMQNHQYQTLPIGKALWVKPTADRVLAKYYVSDKTQQARDVFGLIQDKVLNAHSIGFHSTKSSAPTTKEINARPDLKSAKLIHREWELLEFSVVGIPCNPEALTLAVSKGYSKDTLTFLGADLLKTSAEQAAAKIKELEPDPKSLTEGQLRKMIARELNRLVIAIDPLKVVDDAIRRLTK